MAATARGASDSFRVIQIAAWVSSKSGCISVVVDLAPIGIGWLREIDSRRDERNVLQCAEQWMTLAFPRGWKRRLPSGFLFDAAKDDFAGFHVHLLRSKSCVEPNLGHDVVRRIVAPPSRIVRRIGRQLSSDDPLNFRKCHRYFLAPLGAQKFAQTSVLAHDIIPVVTRHTNKSLKCVKPCFDFGKSQTADSSSSERGLRSTPRRRQRIG